MSRKSGGEFEREICKTLSKWWIGHDRDIVFWRTSQSGGRATIRKRKGQKTSGQCGDICSTDPSSRVFTRLLTVETKWGYRNSGPGDILDRKKIIRGNLNQTQFEKFIEQAINAHENEGTPFWLLIHHRKGCENIAYFPIKLLDQFRICGCLNPPYPSPTFEMTINVNLSDGLKQKIQFVGMRLKTFLLRVSPDDIKKVWRLNKPR
jgi:hypothetical protein